MYLKIISLNGVFNSLVGFLALLSLLKQKVEYCLSRYSIDGEVKWTNEIT